MNVMSRNLNRMLKQLSVIAETDSNDEFPLQISLPTDFNYFFWQERKSQEIYFFLKGPN